MAAETAVSYEALQDQANALTELFKARGYELVAPSYLQPADLFLDRMGEAIRGRTYVFSDMDGEELCLRPDVTLPACRVYLERHPKADVETRLCYNGPAFRYQPGGGDATQPREFRQAGIEFIGGKDREGAETEVTSLIVEAVRAAGLEGFIVHIGDLGLFEALIQALDIPERWRLRMHHFFWRPPVFRDLLKQLSSSPAGDPGPHAGLIAALDREDVEASEGKVAAYLDRAGIPLEGARSLSEITERLLDRAADANETPLSPAIVTLIESYLGISGSPKEALESITELTSKAGLDLGSSLDAAQRRFERFESAGLDLSEFTFSAEFGRDLEYYTGHVFQIEIPGKGRSGQIAGGGRYDDLLQSLGAPRPVPAVGSAIHTERLLSAAQGSRP